MNFDLLAEVHGQSLVTLDTRWKHVISIRLLPEEKQVGRHATGFYLILIAFLEAVLIRQLLFRL